MNITSHNSVPVPEEIPVSVSVKKKIERLEVIYDETRAFHNKSMIIDLFDALDEAIDLGCYPDILQSFMTEISNQMDSLESHIFKLNNFVDDKLGELDSVVENQRIENAHSIDALNEKKDDLEDQIEALKAQLGEVDSALIEQQARRGLN